ncbi:uncharacterized protein [Bemisia tabaci]|uniref:uncharacterized protein n=1 Tax=Bemisia tabaci TaxID=7038 RepID=UPI003B2883D5
MCPSKVFVIFAFVFAVILAQFAIAESSGLFDVGLDEKEVKINDDQKPSVSFAGGFNESPDAKERANEIFSGKLGKCAKENSLCNRKKCCPHLNCVRSELFYFWSFCRKA